MNARLAEDYPEREAEIDEVLEKIFKKNVRKMIARGRREARWARSG